MLKTRVMTAIVIFAVTLAVVFLASPLVFKTILALLIMIGASEYGRISGHTDTMSRTLLVVQALLFVILFITWESASANALPLLVAGCLAWLALAIRLPLYQAGSEPDARFRQLGFLSALVSLTVGWFALSWLQEQAQGQLVLFLLLLIIWASDTGAYFAGKQFGRRKLARVISPKKTWEGVYGGIALALFAAWLWAWPITHMNIALPALATITVITTLTSIVGDLFISLHKRTVGLDDAGQLFPGHGGVLDRYDSLLAGAPFFALAFGLLAQ
jgi:phosphatidate cytidylyltransferase